MDTNSTAVFAQRVSRRAARNVAIIGVVSCLAVVGFAAAVTGADPALSTQINIVSWITPTKRSPAAGAQARFKSLVARRDDTVAPSNRVNRPLAAPLTRSVCTSLGAASPEFRTPRRVPAASRGIPNVLTARV